jgi:hypothetical protein
MAKSFRNDSMCAFLVKSEGYSFVVFSDKIENVLDRIVSVLHEIYMEDLREFYYDREQHILRVRWTNTSEFLDQEDVYSVQPLGMEKFLVMTEYDVVESKQKSLSII